MKAISKFCSIKPIIQLAFVIKMQRKLILSCSKKKNLKENLLPAIQRYDGIAFRLLRRYLRNSCENLDIYILSAEYGLISHLEEIPFYDRKMNKSQVQELQKIIPLQMKRLINEQNLKHSHWFINIGSFYQDAFSEEINFLKSVSNVAIASGSSGKRLAEMYDWLYGQNSPLRISYTSEKIFKIVYFRGKKIDLTTAEIVNIAKKSLENADKNAFSFQSWFVEIGKTRISPKWLVSKLTGLPVNTFHSDEARKLLQKLGIDVIRI